LGSDSLDGHEVILLGGNSGNVGAGTTGFRWTCRGVLVWLVVLLVGCTTGGGAATTATLRPAPSTTAEVGGSRVLPGGFEGVATANAISALGELGLVPVVEGEYSDTIPAGRVIRTDPASGVQVTGGDTVVVYVSRGPEAAPNLQVEPSSGLPGEQLTVCGTAPGLSSLELSMTDPATGYVWPWHISIRPDGETGDWCWRGTIPTQMKVAAGLNSGRLYLTTPGTYDLLAEDAGTVVGRASVDVGALAPSQSPEDATRDGVVAAVAALPFNVRVNPTGEVDMPEGRWVLSEIAPMNPYLLGDCDPTDSACLYGGDYIDVGEYGEVLLLNTAGDRILKAFPLPGFPLANRGSIVATDDAIYCSSQGDGGLPDSILCRIDRTSLDWIVRVFPSDVDSAFSPMPSDWFIPDNWIVDEPVSGALFLGLEVTPDGIVTYGYQHDHLVDPTTLQLNPLPEDHD